MTALEWVGAIVAVLCSLGVAAFGFGYCADKLIDQWEKLVWRYAEKRIRERGTQMIYQQYWWETPEQAAVWLACAEHMAEGNYPQANVIRDNTYVRCLKEIKERRK